jgi:hypothetical protein
MMKTKLLLPALAVGVVLSLGACGSSGTSSTTTTAPAAATDPSTTGGQGAAAGGGASINDPAVQQCLADKGITLPSLPQGQGEGRRAAGGEAPAGGGQGQRPGMDAATRQALQDCGVTVGRGAGGFGGGGAGSNDPAVQQCLADKGITLPPQSEASTGPPSSIDDATRQAIQDCRAQAPTTTTAAG